MGRFSLTILRVIPKNRAINTMFLKDIVQEHNLPVKVRCTSDRVESFTIVDEDSHHYLVRYNNCRDGYLFSLLKENRSDYEVDI